MEDEHHLLGREAGLLAWSMWSEQSEDLHLKDRKEHYLYDWLEVYLPSLELNFLMFEVSLAPNYSPKLWHCQIWDFPSDSIQ